MLEGIFRGFIFAAAHGKPAWPLLLSWAVLTKRNMKSCSFSCFCLQPCCPSPVPWLGWK
ncbi:unnamed protein product, partial [Bubo scandiacus]